MDRLALLSRIHPQSLTRALRDIVLQRCRNFANPCQPDFGGDYSNATNGPF
jgi:hypothetical protein